MQDGDSWKALTMLLHVAYREHLDTGRHDAACAQSPEATQRRCRGGATLLALKRNLLVGTATMHGGVYRNHPGGYISPVAVSPIYRGAGLGRLLLSVLERRAKGADLFYLVCDTAESAGKLVAWYLRQGWRKVSLVFHGHTNYYSVVFFDGGSRLSLSWRYPLSYLKCRLCFRKDGNPTLLKKTMQFAKNSYATTKMENTLLTLWGSRFPKLELGKRRPQEHPNALLVLAPFFAVLHFFLSQMTTIIFYMKLQRIAI